MHDRKIHYKKVSQNVVECCRKGPKRNARQTNRMKRLPETALKMAAEKAQSECLSRE